MIPFWVWIGILIVSIFIGIFQVESISNQPHQWEIIHDGLVSNQYQLKMAIALLWYFFSCFLKAESFATNNARISSTAFSRSQANEQNAYNTNYNLISGTADRRFKQPMPPLTNGSKKIPALLSASSHSFNFNKPQQTINPHYSKYGELSELSSFKNVPELYPINRSNANHSHSTTDRLVNGHVHPSMFTSSRYGSQSNQTSRSTQTNSNHILSTPSILGTSSTYSNDNFSTKSVGLKGNSIFTSVCKHSIVKY